MRYTFLLSGTNNAFLPEKRVIRYRKIKGGHRAGMGKAEGKDEKHYLFFYISFVTLQSLTTLVTSDLTIKMVLDAMHA